MYALAIDSSGNVWVGAHNTESVYEYAGLASHHSRITLRAVIPQHVMVNFQGGTSIVTNLVSQYGQGALYNLPGYNPANDPFPSTIGICFIASNDTVGVSGFAQLAPGNNATELLTTNWVSITQSANGWPEEPACAA